MHIPGPGELLRLPGRALEAVESTLSLVPRLAQLELDLDRLIQEARVVVAAARGTQMLADEVAAAAEITRQHVERVVSEADVISGAASSMVAEVADLAGVGQRLLAKLEPALVSLTPVVQGIADGVSDDDVDAALQVIHRAPAIVDKLTDDVLPVLDSLETVAPDLREVLDVSQGMEEMLGAVPGLGRVRRRVAAQQRRQSNTPAVVEADGAGPIRDDV